MVERSGTGPTNHILAEDSDWDPFEEELPNDNPVVSVGVGRLTTLSKREEDAREEIVRDIVRAKKQLRCRKMSVSFFKDLWPHIFDHLQRTGFKMPEEL